MAEFIGCMLHSSCDEVHFLDECKEKLKCVACVLKCVIGNILCLTHTFCTLKIHLQTAGLCVLSNL